MRTTVMYLYTYLGIYNSNNNNNVIDKLAVNKIQRLRVVNEPLFVCVYYTW